jgi:CubicO group peptidase (beta-lactamase class C family)
VHTNLEEIIESWRASIPDALARLDIPGLAVGVCDRNGILWSAGFGSTEQLGGTPITSHTRFSVQSTSKLITAGVVLTTVGRGLVDLDEPIIRYLPDFRVNSSFDDDPARLITLRHLLSHTAGFTHEAPVGSNYDLGTDDFDEHCRSIYDTWLRFPVGHHFEYSNLGIDLAAFAVQHACGRPFARIVAEAYLAPIGASRATFDPAVIVDDASTTSCG